MQQLKTKWPICAIFKTGIVTKQINFIKCKSKLTFVHIIYQVVIKKKLTVLLGITVWIDEGLILRW